VHVGGVERGAARPVAGQAVEDVVHDPVALLLAQQDVAREAGLLREVPEQVAQQQRRTLHVARRLLEQGEQLGVRLGLGRPHATDSRPCADGLTGRSQLVHGGFTGR
jgi:hypothetical protein